MRRLIDDLGEDANVAVASVMHEFATGIHERHYRYEQGKTTVNEISSYVDDMIDRLYNTIKEAQRGTNYDTDQEPVERTGSNDLPASD